MMPDIEPSAETAAAIARREAAARALQRRKKLHFWILVATWGLAAAIIGFIDLPPWARIAVALIPTIPLAALILFLRRYSRHFDEFGWRVITEAAAAAFGYCVILAFLYSLARMADVGVPRSDWQPILLTM